MTDFAGWLNNLSTQLPEVLKLIVAISYVTGVWFVCLSIMKLKAYGQQTVMMSTHANFTGPLIYLLAGVILIYFPTMVDTSVYTFWAYDTSSSDFMVYPEGNDLDWGGILNPIIAIVRIVGYIAFFRGWVIMAKVGTPGTPPGTFSKAMGHIIGGILAINILGTWEVISSTLGLAT